MREKKVLIIDDEHDICSLIGLTVKNAGLSYITAHSLAEARTHLNSPISLCLCDIRLPDGSGMDLIPEAVAKNIPIAIITAHGNINSAVQALKAGAFDFLAKPLDNEQLTQLLDSALSLPAENIPSMPLLLGDSPPMQKLKALIAKVARSQAPVHISGPSGAGKECVAKSIHALSSRASAPFIPINCGAIPAALMESELFGHKKGSFTGAHEDKIGLFEQANNGTLFLDEVSELPLDMQVKLLRAIQEKKIRPVGATQENPINVRFLSATAQNLSEMVNEKRFREDLFYRLNVIECHVPALSAHKEDIPILVTHILKKQSSDAVFTLTNSALDALMRYAFPGNIRELENILHRAATLTDGPQITAEDLQLPEDRDFSDGSLDEKMEALEKKAILEAIESAHGNKKKAAEILGIPYRSLRYRLSKLQDED